MSVLVEALTLVVPKRVLDASYPGGTDAFLQAALQLAQPPRFVCSGDAHLVNLSFYDSEHLDPATALLHEHAIVDVDLAERRSVDYACVDQACGPTMPCDWIEWARHRDGFTYAWLAGAERGDMAAPSGWTPEQSRQCVRSDVRDDPSRMLRLATEGEFETWLDLETGRQVIGLATRPPETAAPASPAPPPEASDAGATLPNEPPLMPVVRQALTLLGWEHELLLDGSVARYTVVGDHAKYDCAVVVDDETRLVAVLAHSPVRVPELKRLVACELLMRANHATPLGGFDLDFADGEVRFKTTIDVEGGVLAGPMLRTLLTVGISALDRCHPALMRVVYGDASPADAAADLYAPDDPDDADAS